MKPYSVSTFDCSMPECRYFCHYQLYFDIHQHFLSDTVCQRTLRCSLTAASAICYPGSIITMILTWFFTPGHQPQYTLQGWLWTKSNKHLVKQLQTINPGTAADFFEKYFCCLVMFNGHPVRDKLEIAVVVAVCGWICRNKYFAMMISNIVEDISRSH